MFSFIIFSLGELVFMVLEMCLSRVDIINVKNVGLHCRGVKVHQNRCSLPSRGWHSDTFLILD